MRIILNPPAIRDPRRINDKEEKCRYFALSFFITEDQAKEYFYNAIKQTPKLRKIYSHLANGRLKEDDGLQTPPDKYGHFGLHEFEGNPAPLVSKFSIIFEL